MFFVLIALMTAMGISTICILLSHVSLKDRGWFQFAFVAVFALIYVSAVKGFSSLLHADQPFYTVGISLRFFLATFVAAATNVPFIAYALATQMFRIRDALMSEAAPSRKLPDAIELAEREGNLDRAEELLTAAIQENAKDLESRLRLAELYIKMQRPDDAVFQFRRAAEAQNAEKSFAAAIRLAELALAGEAKAEVAVQAISKNLAIFPDSNLAQRGHEFLRLLHEKGQGSIT